LFGRILERVSAIASAKSERFRGVGSWLCDDAGRNLSTDGLGDKLTRGQLLMLVLQNDLRASEKSAEELDDHLNHGPPLATDWFELDDLVRNILSLGHKLLNEPKRLGTLHLDEPVQIRLEDEWSANMHALQKLANHALALCGRYEASEPRGATAERAQLAKLLRHVEAINMFPMSRVREARQNVREGKLTPLSSVKDALCN
jgi:hypothetical protein